MDLKVKFFASDNGATEPLDEQINNWIKKNFLKSRIIDIKFTSQYIFNSSYEGIRDTALVMYED